MKISGLTFALIGLATACSSSGGSTAATGGTGGTPSAGTGGTTAGAASGGAGAGGTSAGGTSAAGTGGLATTAGTGGSGGAGGAATCTKCPATCCDTGSQCVDDGLGNLSCKKTCSTSSECPATAQCCELLKDGTGVCATGTGDNLCRCTKGSECSTKACAPNLDTQGNPVGPYVCVANDGGPYRGCNGALTTCSGTGCCFIDAQQNQFCVSTCTNDSQCGAASCVTYPAKSSTCSGMMGCGPK